MTKSAAKKSSKQQQKAAASKPANPTTKAQPFVLPPFPKDSEITVEVYRGPTKYCNWVIPSTLLVGGFPRRFSDVEEILASGVTVIVCLVEKFEKERIMKNYEDVVKQKNSAVKIISFPIVDRSVGDDEGVAALVDELVQLITQGNKVFVHCVGGHGRGGTIACLVMAKLYQITDSHAALKYIQLFHDTRVKGTDKKSPQMSEQRNQIHRFIKRWAYPDE